MSSLAQFACFALRHKAPDAEAFFARTSSERQFWVLGQQRAVQLFSLGARVLGGFAKTNEWKKRRAACPSDSHRLKVALFLTFTLLPELLKINHLQFLTSPRNLSTDSTSLFKAGALAAGGAV